MKRHSIAGYYIFSQSNMNLKICHERSFSKFYGFDASDVDVQSHLWNLGKVCIGDLKTIYARFYSHYLLYNNVSTMQWSSRFMFVLHENTIFQKNWEEIWFDQLNDIPVDADIVNLCNDKKAKMSMNGNVKESSDGIRLNSYAITKPSINRLLNTIEQTGINTNFEEYVCKQALQIYSLNEPICHIKSWSFSF